MSKRSTAISAPSPDTIRLDILREARVLGLHAGFAEMVSDSVAQKVERYLESHPVVTAKDIDLLVSRELKQYNPDLAYIYRNRDKII
ncbi:hypothetical protein IJI02_00155 [Candidatus Saccharibacteria bacterium]|nr:hypothetical protein [Candidatus Saccharibacteria bacterium]